VTSKTHKRVFHIFPPSCLLIETQSIAVKRILQEAKELQQDPSVEYTARPLEVNFQDLLSTAIIMTLLH
jgi:ubiquitin-protein ligase